MRDPLVLVEETPDGEAVVRHNTTMSENDVLMDLGRQIIGLRREIERYETREEYFGDILSLSDRGRYRADWETAIKRVVAKRDELQTDYNELRDDYDRRSRLAEELSVERDEAKQDALRMFRGLVAVNDENKALREALEELRRPLLCSVFGVPEKEVRRLVGIVDAVLSRPGEQGEVQSAVLCPACGTPLDGKRCPGPECGAIWNMVGGVTLPDPPVTIRDVPHSEVEASKKPGSPRLFQPGDRVRVREDCVDTNWLRSVKGYSGQVGVVIERDEEDEEWPVGVEMPGQTELVCFTDAELELLPAEGDVDEKSAEEATADA